MSLKDRYTGGAPGPTRTFSCPHYDPLPGSKRCRSYLEGGACARPDEFMCVEWLKANGHAVPPPAPGPKRDEGNRDLFGKPVPESEPPAPKSDAAPTQPDGPTSKKPEVPLVRQITDEEIASFKALGAEVCLRSDEIGEVWLVPDYTGADRREISVEHAATLAAVCAAFPGAKVVSFERNDHDEPADSADD